MEGVRGGMNIYQKALEERKKQHLLRALPILPEGIDFYSNDYLGLAQSQSLSLAIEEECRNAPKLNGATGSRLLSGNSEYAEQVEKEIAEFHKAESALIYASGYMANVGLISSLAVKDTTLICDELIHASLIDGVRLGHAKKLRFKHNNLQDLEERLEKTGGQKIVLVESVYSMDGDTCPIKGISDLCKKQDALLIVDEAHAVGIYGEVGEGLVQSLGLENQVFARIFTYGKAPGIHGGAVVGPSWLKEYQVNFSRSMIFSTAPSNHHFASIAAMYKYLSKCGADRNQLKEIIQYFKKNRNPSNGQWLDSGTQIQSLIVPGNKEVVQTAEKLKDAGINALPIRRPSVAEGSERIRFCLHSYNTKEEIDLLFETLK
ncbi:aminotransferase class I/II-fold pyridoxal phosphate-dependent enzyme [Ekhidna sp.]|uniref:aminotransferase class I/II-fold pyridoxal phosphate-dependent enzyme n=1 Tax=Ekhidna sp. TaxID=2608089 RepID=UPI003B506EB5